MAQALDVGIAVSLRTALRVTASCRSVPSANETRHYEKVLLQNRCKRRASSTVPGPSQASASSPLFLNSKKGELPLLRKFQPKFLKLLDNFLAEPEGFELRHFIASHARAREIT